MQAYKLNSHERIIKGKIDLNKTHPFFAYILMNMQIETTKSSDNVPTMGVNAFGDLYWNEDFVKGLSDPELRFVLCHETLHVATLTFKRQGMRDHGLWNIATDLIINWMLVQDGFSAPKDICCPDTRGIFKFPGKTGKDVVIDLNNKVAEEVYEELLKNAKVIKQAVSMDGDGNYKGGFDKHLPGDTDSEGKEQGKNKTTADKEANEQAWKRKATEASTQAKMRGNLSASLERMLGKLFDPVVDWRTRLFAYITNELPVDYTMRMPSRRFCSTGVYTPTVLKENLNVIVGVDVSGSISMDEYIEFMSECIGIADSYSQVKMRVIAWASDVDERDDILVTNDSKAQLMEHKFVNSGGTTLTSFTKYCEKKGYKSKIYVVLTDGYVEGTPTLPSDGDTMFVLSKNGTSEIVKNHGEVASLNDVTR